MNLYQRIKAAVTTRQAAESYGLKVSPSGMALCPFHNDHHPSLKLDKRYYCFGCGEQGDVIDFTARYLGVSPHSAAIQLARDFGLCPGRYRGFAGGNGSSLPRTSAIFGMTDSWKPV